MPKKVVNFASPYVFQDDGSLNNSNNRSGRTAPSSSSSAEGADINVMSLQLGHLTQRSTEPITGDPVFCASCNAIFNSLSSHTSNGDSIAWECEFCNHSNELHLEPEELPKFDDLDYIIEPVQQTEQKDDEGLVIFCIDTSGSMCVTSEVYGEDSKLESKKNKDLEKFVERGASQHLPRQGKNVQYISRLQSVQSAVATQIEHFQKNNPNKKLGVVTFNSEVQVLWSTKEEPIFIAGDKLDDYEEIVKIGKSAQITEGVSKSKDYLSQRLKDLQEEGGTALGPALLTSCAMAEGKPGSKVIICTDGMANTGLGSMEDLVTDAEKERAKGFYTRIADYAKESGITVSVVTIAGTHCSMENLGKISDFTGGDVNIVDPVQMAKNFTAMLQKPIVATNVRVTLISHSEVKFSNGQHKTSQNIGNVDCDSNLTFEFRVPAATSGFKNGVLPFQVQIEYRPTSGPKCVRVISSQKSLTTDRTTAEKDVDVAVIGVHVSKRSASLAQDGLYSAARQNAAAYQQLLDRAVHTEEQRQLLVQYNHEMGEAYSVLDHAEATERQNNLLLDDISEESAPMMNMRSEMRDDVTSTTMYQYKGQKAAACVIQ